MFSKVFFFIYIVQVVYEKPGASASLPIPANLYNLIQLNKYAVGPCHCSDLHLPS